MGQLSGEPKGVEQALRTQRALKCRQNMINILTIYRAFAKLPVRPGQKRSCALHLLRQEFLNIRLTRAEGFRDTASWPGLEGVVRRIIPVPSFMLTSVSTVSSFLFACLRRLPVVHPFSYRSPHRRSIL